MFVFMSYRIVLIGWMIGIFADVNHFKEGLYEGYISI